MFSDFDLLIASIPFNLNVRYNQVFFIHGHTPRNSQRGSGKNETLRQRYDFNFPIVNFPFICINIPAAPVYGFYIFQLIRYSRVCGSYQDFLDIGLLANQMFLVVKFKSSLRKFYGRLHDLINCCGISVSQMTTDMFRFS